MLNRTGKDQYTTGVSERILSGGVRVDAGAATGSFRRIGTNAGVVTGLILIGIVAFLAIFAPAISRYDPNAIDLENMLAPPSLEHLLGTDNLGRDVLTRVAYGGRASLVIGIVPSIISLVLGTVLGLMAGFMGKLVDSVIMRLADVVLAFPSLLLAMVVMYTLGGSVLNMFIALSIINWAGTARVVRAQTLLLKETEFVNAARSMGVSAPRIIFRHILPNCLPNLIVLFTLDIPAAIMWESSMSFLNVADPNVASWGMMIYRGKQFAYSCPWVILAPGVAIIVTVMAFNFLGDGLCDAIDPYMKS